MSLGETLIKALMDTLMGMGTVFLILILISIIISLFKFIRKAEPAPLKEEVQTAGRTEDDSEDEIIAVIMAALKMARESEAASLNDAALEAGTGEYVVRSIKRRR